MFPKERKNTNEKKGLKNQNETKSKNQNKIVRSEK